MNFAIWQRCLNNLSRKTRSRTADGKSVRSARPRFEVLEGREVPAVFVPGSIQGQDGWSGGIVPISSSVDQAVDLSGSNAHAGAGAWHISNNTSNGNHNGAFAGWVFTPGLSVSAGQPSSGAAGDLFTATFFVRAGSSLADGSNMEVDLGSSAGDDRNTFLAITNDSDGDGGLKLRIAEPDGVTGDFKPTQIIATGMSRTDWHRIDIVARFNDGVGNDTFEVFLDGNVMTNPTTGGTTFGTFEGWRDGNSSPYVLSNRLLFRSGAAPSAYDPSFADSAAKGFFIDDVSYSVATQANPNVKLASYSAMFEQAGIVSSNTYVDDSWAGTPIGVDPDGAGGATAFGYDAFASIQEGIDHVLAGGTVNVGAGVYNEKITVNKSVNLLGAQAGVDARDGRPGANESVLDGLGGSTPLYVTSSNVTIDGFTIQGNTSGNQFGYGVLLGAGTSGSHVLNNIIQDNIIGLGLANNSALNQTVIQNNLFRNNNNPGPAGGNAIYSDEYVAGGAMTNVLIDANRFEGHDDAALNLSATVPGSQSHITFSNNDVVNNGRAAFLFNVVDSTFNNNVVSGSTFAASADFRIFGGVQNVYFTENLLSDGAGDAFRVSGSSNQDLRINGNSMTGYTGDGIEVVNGAYTGAPLDATGNWWGASTAAGVATEVKGNVDFMPFLRTGVDTSAEHGFQGDTSVATGEGNVRVRVVGKRLFITGDKLDNLVTIEKGPTANSYRVTGVAGTHINGRSGSFVFENVTRGIEANLRRGDDMLVLDGSATPFTVPGTIVVGTGSGDDLVRFQGVSALGKSVIGSWSGSDVVQLSDSDFGALAVRMNKGDSTSLLMDGVTVTGPTEVWGGNGADTIRLEGVHAAGRVQVETGGGSDLVAVSNSTFDAAAVLSGGFGHDDLDAGTLGVSNTNGNIFGVDPVIRSFENILS